MAGSSGRSRSKRPTSSAAKCCASAADPPLPHGEDLAVGEQAVGDQRRRRARCAAPCTSAASCLRRARIGEMRADALLVVDHRACIVRRALSPTRSRRAASRCAPGRAHRAGSRRSGRAGRRAGAADRRCAAATMRALLGRRDALGRAAEGSPSGASAPRRTPASSPSRAIEVDLAARACGNCARRSQGPAPSRKSAASASARASACAGARCQRRGRRAGRAGRHGKTASAALALELALVAEREVADRAVELEPVGRAVDERLRDAERVEPERIQARRARRCRRRAAAGRRTPARRARRSTGSRRRGCRRGRARPRACGRSNTSPLAYAVTGPRYGLTSAARSPSIASTTASGWRLAERRAAGCRATRPSARPHARPATLPPPAIHSLVNAVGEAAHQRRVALDDVDAPARRRRARGGR